MDDAPRRVVVGAQLDGAGDAGATDLGRLDVVAEPIQQGRTLQLWQVVLTRSGDGKLVARGQVRLQNVALPGA